MGLGLSGKSTSGSNRRMRLRPPGRDGEDLRKKGDSRRGCYGSGSLPREERAAVLATLLEPFVGKRAPAS